MLAMSFMFINKGFQLYIINWSDLKCEHFVFNKIIFISYIMLVKLFISSAANIWFWT